MWILLPCVLDDLCWSACLARDGWENMEWDDLWDDETDFSFTCLTSLTAGASGWWKLISLREVEFFPHFYLIPILLTISVSLLIWCYSSARLLSTLVNLLQARIDITSSENTFRDSETLPPGNIERFLIDTLQQKDDADSSSQLGESWHVQSSTVLTSPSPANWSNSFWNWQIYLRRKLLENTIKADFVFYK